MSDIDWASDLSNTPGPATMTPGGPQPAAARPSFMERLRSGKPEGLDHLIFAIPGFAESYQRNQGMRLQREQMAAMQEDRARRAQAEDFDTLAKIMSASPEYRDVLFDYWGKQKGGGKLSPEMEAYKGILKKADDDTVALLQEVFGELSGGLRDNKLDLKKVQSVTKDPIKAVEFIGKWAAAKRGQEDQKALASAASGGAIVPSGPVAEGGPVPAGGNGAPPAAPAPANSVESLQARRAAIENIIPKLGTGEALAKAQALIKTIDDRIERLTGVVGGFNEAIAGPDGEEIKVRYNAMGEPVNILGKAAKQWEITEANGKKVMVEKGPKGRVVEIGAATQSGRGTLPERIAAARLAYKRDPSPENKAALEEAEESLKVETDLARARSVNVNLGQPPSAAQIKDVAEMEGKVSSIDNLLTTIDENPDLKKVVGPGTPWLRRKFGEFIGEPVEVWGTKLGVTPDQREFLASLATVSGELRRFQAGLTQTAYEIAKTAPSLPDQGDPMEGVIGKLRAYRGWLVRNRGALEGAMQRSGVRAPGMNVPPAPKGGGGSTKPAKTSVNLGGRMYDVEAVP